MKKWLGLVMLWLLGCPFLAGKEFRLPAPQELILDNGVKVYFLPDSDLPLVHFRLLVRGAGSASEPEGQDGAADLTAHLLLKGAGRMSAEEVAAELDFLGAGLEAEAREEFADLSGSCLAASFPRLMRLLSTCLTEPALAGAEFEPERARRIDAVKASKDDPRNAVEAYFRKAFFGAHPLGRLTAGSEASLAGLTPAGLREYYRTRYRPDRAILAVVGDVGLAQLTSVLKDTLGAWKIPADPAPPLDLPPLEAVQGCRILLVDKPDATQAYFILGAPGFAMGDPVTPAATVLNTLLGGRFTSWLNSELRIKRGLTYGAHSDFESWRPGGLFTVFSFTRNATIGEMLEISLDLIQKARQKGFSPTEVTSARNYIRGQFPPTMESSPSKAQAYSELAFYGLGFDFYDRLQAQIQGVDPSAVRTAAQRLLPDQNYVLVVVGNAAEIRPQLEKFGVPVEKRLADPGF